MSRIYEVLAEAGVWLLFYIDDIIDSVRARNSLPR